MQKDIVFIDTSVYVKEKYFSEGNAITTLYKLAKEGIISIVSTDITNPTNSSFCRVRQVSNADKHRWFERFKRFSAKSTIKIAQ